MKNQFSYVTSLKPALFFFQGSCERHETWGPLPEVTAFRAMAYGYTRLTAHNQSHLQIQQVSDDQVQFRTNTLFIWGKSYNTFSKVPRFKPWNTALMEWNPTPKFSHLHFCGSGETVQNLVHKI